MRAKCRSCRAGYGIILIAAVLHCATEPEVGFRADDLRARFDLRSLGPIPYPTDNAPSPSKIELGQLLFFDPILSGERDVACSTCHHPDFAFTDNRQFSAGVSGRGLGPTRSLSASAFTGHAITETPRNSPTVLNVAFATDESGQPSHRAPLFWDGRAIGLEGQALDPIASRVEMRGDAFPGNEHEAASVAVDSIISRLRNIPAYVDRFLVAFPEHPAARGDAPNEAIVDSSTLARSIAAYQRELVTPTSPYDRFVDGDDDAFSQAQMDGLEIFFTKGGCVECHAAPTFSSFGYRVTGVPAAGVGKTIVPGDDTGREEHTLLPADRYAFRVPTLRNVELTSPYMHSGVFETLEDVVRFYNNGARPRHPNVRDDDLATNLGRPSGLNEEEIGALVEFLRSLTGFDEVQGQPLFSEPDLVPSGLTDRYGNAFNKVVMAGIVTGSWHSCAISGVGSGVPNGTAYCWGRNDEGQLGNGLAPSGGFRSNPQRVLDPATGGGIDGDQGEVLRFLRLAVGGNYSCGLADRRLFCWGGEPIGHNSTRPILIEGDIGFRSLTGGDNHVCGLDEAGTLYCLGDNTHGQLGTGTQVSTATPVAIGGVRFEEIDAGGAHTCALTDEGTAYCWGSNEYGQIGNGTTSTNVLHPTQVAGGLIFDEITAGVYHTCGLTRDDIAFCWGKNDFGQVGIDTTRAFSASPVQVNGVHTYKTIAAGLHHTCATTERKVIYCWGSNEVGQLGTELPLGGIRTRPDSVQTHLPFRELSAGRYHTCSTNSELGFCWGGNQYGQVGNGGTAPNLIPKLVIGRP